ncbi:methyltransferase domain-containing protein [Geomonas propionica]|uniref:Methyltransferase domain-containing protein n=1 Tax=Geomonas propionica TaxID=2798582 RepID=A0ABS0YXJ1_9BACT|nr:methyltransferase domain-containing protein [Geomonas propionica]MBJ6802205.1 methyltransferase domain-containing protein [Geomonas propionica]
MMPAREPAGAAAAVAGHYRSPDLESRVLAALVAAGMDPDRLRPEELAAIDEFHVRGAAATRELAAVLEPRPGLRVLDVGCGVGGASRYLVRHFDCRVTGIDQSPDYCAVATMLAARLGMGDRVSYLQADALALPFEDGAFDLVWTQHVSMNIEDKRRFYHEIRRVLAPGGRLACYEVLSGPGGDVHFPVPWARYPSASFLVSRQEFSQLISQAGFETVVSQDVTEEGLAWFRGRQRKSSGAPPNPFGLQLLLGEDFPRMAGNQLRNLEEQRISLVQGVFQAAGGVMVFSQQGSRTGGSP